jgi:hypothetical protein
MCETLTGGRMFRVAPEKDFGIQEFVQVTKNEAEPLFQVAQVWGTTAKPCTAAAAGFLVESTGSSSDDASAKAFTISFFVGIAW